MPEGISRPNQQSVSTSEKTSKDNQSTNFDRKKMQARNPLPVAKKPVTIPQKDGAATKDRVVTAKDGVEDLYAQADLSKKTPKIKNGRPILFCLES